MINAVKREKYIRGNLFESHFSVFDKFERAIADLGQSEVLIGRLTRPYLKIYSFAHYNSLLYKHRIAEGEKSVFLVHGGLVYIEHLFSLVECRDEHEKRRLREVEIGYQRVGRLETVAGIYEDSGISADGMNDSVIVRNALECTARGSSDADCASACSAAAVDDICALFADGNIFGVHDVLADILLLDGAEGSETDMEHDGHDRNSLRLDALKKLGGKVQSRGRRGGRTLALRIYCLIAGLILKLRRNVGRQGHYSDLGEHVVYVCKTIFVVFKTNESISFLDYILNRCNQNSISEDHLHSDAGAFSGLDESFPKIVSALTEKEKFDHSLFSALGMAVKTCGNDLRIVYDEGVALVQTVDYIVKVLVFKLAALAVNTEKTRGVAGLCGVLCDLLFGQKIVKIRGAKACLGLRVYNNITHFKSHIKYN